LHQVKAGFESASQSSADQFTIRPRFRATRPSFRSSRRSRTVEHLRQNTTLARRARGVRAGQIELKDLDREPRPSADYFDANSVVPAMRRIPACIILSNPSTSTRAYGRPRPRCPAPDLTAYPGPVETVSRGAARVHAERRWTPDGLSPSSGVVSDHRPGVIHFSYAIFSRYRNSSICTATRISRCLPRLGVNHQTSFYGNAALKPQRTTQYEIGLSQRSCRNVGIDVTVFYRTFATGCRRAT